MSTNVTLLLLFVTLASVTAQTFQYSRGWTNGKRDGNVTPKLKRHYNILDKYFTPCQINKLKYILDRKPIPDRLMEPCDLPDNNGLPRGLDEINLKAVMEDYINEN